jgi:hypothetical protein
VKEKKKRNSASRATVAAPATKRKTKNSSSTSRVAAVSSANPAWTLKTCRR